MADDAHKNLEEAIKAYREAHNKDPRFAHTLSRLDAVMRDAGSAHAPTKASPGQQAALAASLARQTSPVSPPQVAQTAPAPQQGESPSDFAAARQMAAERFFAAKAS